MRGRKKKKEERTSERKEEIEVESAHVCIIKSEGARRWTGEELNLIYLVIIGCNSV